MRNVARLAWFASALLAGCAASLGGEDLIVKSWQGGTADDLVMAWGPPTHVTLLDDGRRLMRWGEETVRIPERPSMALGPARGLTAPNLITGTETAVDYDKDRYCMRSITVTATGEIAGGSARGSGCCVEAARGECAALLRKPARP